MNISTSCARTEQISIFEQTSLEKMPARARDKVDDTGRYLPFFGFSVVAARGLAQNMIWDNIYNALNRNEFIKEYYSLLPPSSYHMTTLNLISKTGPVTDAWRTQVNGLLPRFSTIQQRLSNETFNLNITGVRKIGVAGTIQLQVSVQDEDKVKTFARDLDHESGLPDPLHVTLGYLYRDDLPSPETARTIRDQINAIVQAQWTPATSPLTLEQPQLCYFTDMCEFIPWPGESCPF